MIVFLEDQASDFFYYQQNLDNIGEAVIRMSGNDMLEFLLSPVNPLKSTIEAIIVNGIHRPEEVLSRINKTMDIPVIVLVAKNNLEEIKRSFALGADDVVLKPVHYRELMVRLGSIKRRYLQRSSVDGEEPIVVHFDGRDPEYRGEAMQLPPRERRVLEYLAHLNGRRVTRAQIFDALYGLFEQQFSESVVESHICKLRKKLKGVLGRDPISMVRYQGYQLDPDCVITQRDFGREIAA